MSRREMFWLGKKRFKYAPMPTLADFTVRRLVNMYFHHNTTASLVNSSLPAQLPLLSLDPVNPMSSYPRQSDRNHTHPHLLQFGWGYHSSAKKSILFVMSTGSVFVLLICHASLTYQQEFDHGLLGCGREDSRLR